MPGFCVAQPGSLSLSRSIELFMEIPQKAWLNRRSGPWCRVPWRAPVSLLTWTSPGSSSERRFAEYYKVLLRILILKHAAVLLNQKKHFSSKSKISWHRLLFWDGIPYCVDQRQVSPSHLMSSSYSQIHIIAASQLLEVEISYQSSTTRKETESKTIKHCPL